LADLKLEDGAGFRNFVRMTPSDFEILLQICSKISGYLATGEYFTKSILQRTPASLGIHRFLGLSATLRFQCLYFLVYLHRSNTVFCSQSTTRINFALRCRI
jgi:hypothetical protein